MKLLKHLVSLTILATASLHASANIPDAPPDTPPAVLPVSDLITPVSAMTAAVHMLQDPAPASIKAAVKEPKLGTPLNQGATGGCVIWANCNYQNTDPAKRFKRDNAYALEVYKYILAKEGYPGQLENGTSPWDTEVYFRNQGVYSKIPPYDIERERELRKTILTEGPCILATTWYTGFDYPTQGTGGRGRIWLTGQVRGAHMILVFWFDQKTKMYWLFNSWHTFPPYDKYGDVVEIPANAIRKLLANGAYAQHPTKVKK